MKVRLYKNKKLIENTPRLMGLQEPLMYAFSAGSADYTFAEGEEIPSEISSEYVMMETEVNDEELTKTYSDAKAEGYQGDITAVAKLMAMHIPLNMRSAVDTIPTSNIQYNTIRDTLNAHGGVVNNNTWTAFKAAAEIDIWSKKKPVHVFNTPFCQDFDTSAPNYKEGWWQSWDGNCGLVPQSVASYRNIPDAHDDGMNGWTYELPEGGERDPLRLGDFAGYYSNAKPIVTNFAVTPSTVSNRVGNSNFGGNCLALVYPDDKQLTFADFPFLGEYYFGMVCVHNQQGLMYRATATTKVKDGGYIVQMNANGMNTGEYTCYPFLAQYQLTQSGSDMGGKCYTLPNLKKQTLSVVETQVFIKIVCKEVVKEVFGYTVKYEIWASNFYSSAQTIKSNSAYLRWIKNSWGDALESPERQQTVPDFTIPAADDGGNISKVYYTGEFEVSSEEFIRSCKLMVECGNGSYRNQSFVPIPSPEYNNLLNK